MRTRTILLLVLALVIAGALLGRYLYARPTPRAAEQEADLRASAADLYQAFTADEAKANATYNDKVVEVEGTVRSVDRDADGRINVLLETGDALGAVVCEFAAGETVRCEAGHPVRIKGYCAGFNLDVLLQRCAEVDVPKPS